jgi:Ca2+-binding RTX toxin-like protein
VTYDDWHLPTTVQPDATCSSQGGFSSGSNCTGSDMGHLFYVELGGTAFTSILDSNDPDLALFSNIGEDGYWSETSFDATNAHVFNFLYGLQAPDQKILGYYAWAVRDGDVGGGSGGCNAVNGTAGDDSLEGTTGEDCINGKAGADSMSGLGGDDTYTVDNTGDTVVEGAGEGTDTIRASVTYTLPIYVEKLTLTGTSAINGTGNGLANVLTGNSAANKLNGRAGADTMAGKAGNDTYYVDNTGDKVTEGADQGTDTIRSTITRTLPNNVEHLILTGAANINGTGNALANKLTGNGAANTLSGKAGNDTLVGGAGPDRFLFNTTPNSSTNYDRITDFDPADDTVRLEDSVFTALPVGTLAASAFATGTAATTAAHRIIYDPATGNVRYDADGNGPTPAVRFAQMTTKPALTRADFSVQ